MGSASERAAVRIGAVPLDSLAVWVRDLPLSMRGDGAATRASLEAAFSPFGALTAIVADRAPDYAHVYFADESAAAAVLARGAVLVRGQACQCNPAPQRRAPLPRAAFVSDEARRRADGAAAAAFKEAAAAAGLAPGAVPRDFRPGDWLCVTCKVCVMGKFSTCKGCGAGKPAALPLRSHSKAAVSAGTG